MGGDASDWQAADATLRGRAPLDLGYCSDLLQDVASSPIDDKLVVVRGLRRVGKSVLLKDTAATLCRRPSWRRMALELRLESVRIRSLLLIRLTDRCKNEITAIVQEHLPVRESLVC
jgi:hypothetical protein